MPGHHQSMVVSSEIVIKNHNPLVDRKAFQTGFFKRSALQYLYIMEGRSPEELYGI
jgi:hypothetical protein